MLVFVALVDVVDVLARMVFVFVALMHVVHMTLFVTVVLVVIAFVRVVHVLTGVMLVFVALVNFMGMCGHFSLLWSISFASTI